MRQVMLAGLILAGSAGLAAAQGGPSNPPIQTTQCLDVGGQTLPVVCRVPASRLDQREDFCICQDGIKVSAPVCGSGQKPPAESRAFERARKDAARDGSLLGDLFEGQPMCVAPRQTW